MSILFVVLLSLLILGELFILRGLGDCIQRLRRIEHEMDRQIR